MTSNQLDIMERMVKLAIRWARLNQIKTDVSTWGVSYSMGRQRWRSKDDACCGLGCLLLFAGKTESYSLNGAVSEILKTDITWQELQCFVDGWDGKIRNEGGEFWTPELYELGRRMREFASNLTAGG